MQLAADCYVSRELRRLVPDDADAYYIFIDTDRLAAGDFSKLDSTFENH